MHISTRDITEYIEHHARLVTPATAEAFRQHIPALQFKSAEIDASQAPLLPRQLDFLIELFEDVLDGVYTEFSYAAFGEAVFALQYLLQSVDLIPDSLPGLGFKDDASIVAAVLARNAADMETFCRAKGIDWDAIVGTRDKSGV
jgi:uncharacterized membrane protein YkvA (DUF1232 family)